MPPQILIPRAFRPGAGLIGAGFAVSPWDLPAFHSQPAMLAAALPAWGGRPAGAQPVP